MEKQTKKYLALGIITLIPISMVIIFFLQSSITPRMNEITMSEHPPSSDSSGNTPISPDAPENMLNSEKQLMPELLLNPITTFSNPFLDSVKGLLGLSEETALNDPKLDLNGVAEQSSSQGLSNSETPKNTGTIKEKPMGLTKDAKLAIVLGSSLILLLFLWYFGVFALLWNYIWVFGIGWALVILLIIGIIIYNIIRWF